MTDKESPVPVAAPVDPQALRKEIRGAVFDSKNRKHQIITLFGNKVELIQPDLREALAHQDADDRAVSMANMLIRYCFVPGTTVKVFEAADVDMIVALPFGEEIIGLNKAIAKLTGTSVEEMEEAGKKAEEELDRPLENKS